MSHPDNLFLSEDDLPEAIHVPSIPCGNCGAASPIWTRVEYDGPTGVCHPDGGQEWQHQSGWLCGACKMVTEDRDA